MSGIGAGELALLYDDLVGSSGLGSGVASADGFGADDIEDEGSGFGDGDAGGCGDPYETWSGAGRGRSTGAGRDVEGGAVRETVGAGCKVGHGRRDGSGSSHGTSRFRGWQ